MFCTACFFLVKKLTYHEILEQHSQGSHRQYCFASFPKRWRRGVALVVVAEGEEVLAPPVVANHSTLEPVVEVVSVERSASPHHDVVSRN